MKSFPIGFTEISLSPNALSLSSRTAVIVPMVFHLPGVVATSPIVQAIFDRIENLEEGSNILISYDFGPATVPENQPMAERPMTR